MSRIDMRPARKQDRSTLYGVFLIISLLPTAFSVAFEYSARGVTSGRPWLVSLFPLVLLVAARFLPTVWHRSIPAVWVLSVLVIAAGAGFVWNLGGLLGFLGVHGPVSYIAPVVITFMYVGFGALMGSIRDRAARLRTRARIADVARRQYDQELDRQLQRQPVTRAPRSR